MRSCAAVIGLVCTSWLRHSGDTAAASCGACGNSEAVWPSAPMPSTAMSGVGKAVSASARAAAGSDTSVCSPTSGRNRAAAAVCCSRWRCTSTALLSACCGGTSRSSTRVMVTFGQSSFACDKASKNAMGERPPDTASTAWPCVCRQSRRQLATASASAAAWVEGEGKVCQVRDGGIKDFPVVKCKISGSLRLPERGDGLI